MQSPPAPCRVFPSGSKYLPPHHILENPQPIFLARYEGQTFILYETTPQNYSSVYFNLFLYQLNYTG